MSIYYHYTTPESARAILQSGVIKKSTKRAKGRDDALFGSGVYLTQIPPTNSRTVIALNNYDGANLAAVERIIGAGEPC